MRMARIGLLAVVLTMGLLAGSAQAVVLAGDTFTGGTAGTTISGRSVEVGTGTWSVQAGSELEFQFTAGGEVGQGTSGLRDHLAGIAFTPQAGFTYTVQADLNAADGGEGGFIAIGFANAVGGSKLNNVGLAWFFLSCDGNGQYFTGPGTGGGGNFSCSDAPHTLTSELTYNPGGTSVWNCYVDAGLVVGPIDIVNIDTIVGAEFSWQNPNPNLTVDNFLLTEVPEPATLALLGLGGLGLLVRRKR